MLWTDIPSGVHHTIKFLSPMMQKGQWSCQKDVSVRRLLLPQWLIQPLLPTFTRPQERQLSGFLLLLLHRNMLLKHSPAAPLPGRGSCMFSHCGVTRARSQKCAWVLFLRWEQHSTMLPLQPQQLSSCSLAHTPGAVTVSNNSHLSHFCYLVFSFQQRPEVVSWDGE